MESFFFYYTGVMWLYAIVAAVIGSAIMVKLSKERIFWFFLALILNFYFFVFILIYGIVKKKFEKRDLLKISYIIAGYVVFVIFPLSLELFFLK